MAKSRKEKKADRKISKAKGTKREAKVEKKYGYNYEGAKKAGLEPDESGHWPSRNPETGEILKGRKHPTIKKTKKAEKDLGYKIKRRKGNLYSEVRKRRRK